MFLSAETWLSTCAASFFRIASRAIRARLWASSWASATFDSSTNLAKRFTNSLSRCGGLCDILAASSHLLPSPPHSCFLALHWKRWVLRCTLQGQSTAIRRNGHWRATANKQSDIGRRHPGAAHRHAAIAGMSPGRSDFLALLWLRLWRYRFLDRCHQPNLNGHTGGNRVWIGKHPIGKPLSLLHRSSVIVFAVKRVEQAITVPASTNRRLDRCFGWTLRNRGDCIARVQHGHILSKESQKFTLALVHGSLAIACEFAPQPIAGPQSQL